MTMSKTKKTVSIVFILMLMAAFFAVLTFYQNAENLSFRFIPLSKYPLIGKYLPNALFWLSIGLIILCLLAILVILFYPKRTAKMKLKNSDKLKVERGAVKGYVQSLLEQKDFASSPSVKVSMIKRRISVKIKGHLKRTTELYEKNALLEDEIRSSLLELFGPKQRFNIKVAYKEHEERQKSSSERVV